jgi:hypothetical protein
MVSSDFSNLRCLEQCISFLELEDSKPSCGASCKENMMKKNFQIYEDVTSLEKVNYSSGIEDDCNPSIHLHRQISIPSQIQQRPNETKEITHQSSRVKGRIRCPSTYEAKQRRKIFVQNQDMKKYLESLKEKKMSSAIQRLIDFDLSVNMASSSETRLCNAPDNLHYSCPVLSYIYDEEDSLDLAVQRQRKRRSYHLDSDEKTEESWESLDDVHYFDESIECLVNIEAFNHDDNKPRIKRRRPYSCLK